MNGSPEFLTVRSRDAERGAVRDELTAAVGEQWGPHEFLKILDIDPRVAVRTSEGQPRGLREAGSGRSNDSTGTPRIARYSVGELASP